jgi:hypothetical protein
VHSLNLHVLHVLLLPIQQHLHHHCYPIVFLVLLVHFQPELVLQLQPHVNYVNLDLLVSKEILLVHLVQFQVILNPLEEIKHLVLNVHQELTPQSPVQIQVVIVLNALVDLILMLLEALNAHFVQKEHGLIL